MADILCMHHKNIEHHKSSRPSLERSSWMFVRVFVDIELVVDFYIQQSCVIYLANAATRGVIQALQILVGEVERMAFHQKIVIFDTKTSH